MKEEGRDGHVARLSSHVFNPVNCVTLDGQMVVLLGGLHPLKIQPPLFLASIACEFEETKDD